MKKMITRRNFLAAAGVVLPVLRLVPLLPVRPSRWASWAP